MIELNIPGYKNLKIHNIVFDYNGTLAIDGIPINNCLKYLNKLNEEVNLYVLTADTFRTVESHLPEYITLKIINNENQQQEKKKFVESLGEENTIAVGNGFNDNLMLETAVLGISVIQEEGVSTKTMSKADLVYTDIIDLIKSLINKKRLIASLRR